MRMEAVVNYFNIISWYYLEGLKKTTKELRVGFEDPTAAVLKCSLLQAVRDICFMKVS
jgi:hypothetical protein